MSSARVLVPSFNDAQLARLIVNMEDMEQHSSLLVTVLDNGLSEHFSRNHPDLHIIQTPREPFVFSQAFNIGANFHPLDDIIALGDDVIIETKDWLKNCIARFDDWPMDYGVLALAESSTSSVYGRFPHSDDVIELPDVALGAGILIPRWVLDQIGPWDDSLVGYGFDDFDYGIRCYHAGLKLGITGAARIDNRAQAVSWVKRLGSYDAVLKHQDINFDVYHQKWYGKIPEPRLVIRPEMETHFMRQLCECRNV